MRGGISARHPEHPDRFLLSCSRSPEFVSEADIVEHGLDGEAVHPETRALFYERFIPAAIYEAAPAVQSVVTRMPTTCCRSASHPSRCAA